MEIPAKRIIDQLDLQLTKLKSAIVHEDKQSVSECVTVIEAYCQLLKSPSTKEVEQPKPMYTEVTQKQYSMPVQSVTNNEQELKGRNLLEF